MCQKCQAKANANTYYPQPNRGFQAPPSGAIPRQMPSSAPTNKQVDPPAPAAPRSAAAFHRPQDAGSQAPRRQRRDLRRCEEAAALRRRARAGPTGSSKAARKRR